MGLLEGFVTYDAGIGKVLGDFETLGIFAYVLPFILIFAVVFAVLDKIPIFQGKKGINMVIALAVGLLSLQFNVVTVFFGEIFPRAGIGLSVVIVALILAGAFIKWDDTSSHKWIFFGIGALAFIIITITSLSAFSSPGFNWWDQYGSAIIILLIVIGLVVAVMVSKGGSGGSSKGSSG
ncbi:hypothetical protein J4447_04595 [Candidatus Pacearchaeota archaeon]|nr:hypothetical protein [Candidatus Pacearchaeota archaeon]